MPFDGGDLFNERFWDPKPKPEPIPGLLNTYVEVIQAVGFLAIASGTCWWVVIRLAVR